MFWDTVSSRFCFCWLFTASPSPLQRTLSDFSIDHLVMSMSRLCNYLDHSILYSHKKCIKVCSPEFTSTQYSQRFTLFQPDECDMVDDRVMFGESLNLLSSLFSHLWNGHHTSYLTGYCLGCARLCENQKQVPMLCEWTRTVGFL